MDLRNVTMRKFRTEDAVAVSKIIRNNFMDVNSKDYSEEVAQRANDQFTPKFVLSMSNKRKMYVAVEDGIIVGTASIDFDTISNIFVDIEYHSKGIDKMLISLLEEIADNNGLRLVKLVAAASVQKRYEKLGYDTVEEIESEMFGKEILMQRYLA
ncbi:MAG TPA: GNAT family N-acetyltransferase [Patescibacteria group bacterium]|nr:GNAT family N-acetyltransferase [Patescibacteria group bacterium]